VHNQHEDRDPGYNLSLVQLRSASDRGALRTEGNPQGQIFWLDGMAAPESRQLPKRWHAIITQLEDSVPRSLLEG